MDNGPLLQPTHIHKQVDNSKRKKLKAETGTYRRKKGPKSYLSAVTSINRSVGKHTWAARLVYAARIQNIAAHNKYKYNP